MKTAAYATDTTRALQERMRSRVFMTRLFLAGIACFSVFTICISLPRASPPLMNEVMEVKDNNMPRRKDGAQASGVVKKEKVQKQQLSAAKNDSNKMLEEAIIKAAVANVKGENRLEQGAPQKKSFVVCGSHTAKSCQECPQGNGAGWCNGDCEWRKGECVFAKMVNCGGHSEMRCEDCPRGNGEGWCNGDCRWKHGRCVKKKSNVHPEYYNLIKHYPFQPVQNDKGEEVNIILVRSPFRNRLQNKLYHKYKNEILFMGISSFEAFPLPSPNPYSENFPIDKYTGLFPGFLTMMREPDRKKYFPKHVKTLLLSQSDFNIDSALRYGKKTVPKKYDFTYSGSDQEVEHDCVGWSSFAKNWSFVKEALEVMCSDEYNMTGVLVATKNKNATKACTIPKSCDGKMVQTTFLNERQFYNYVVQSKFVFLPQIYDASPRVAAQGLAMNVPLLMNDNIIGGWKYLNNKTGEFFHDMSNFKQSLRRLLSNADTNKYEPRQFIQDNYGSEKAGKKLLDFVNEHFSDRVKLPNGTRWLVPNFI